MAYISTEKVKEMRNKLKELFPTKKGWKISVTKQNYSSVNEYKLSTEITTPHRLSEGPDTNNQECILCWINFNDYYGERFAVKGNIYHGGEPRWSHFTDYFVCPIQRERNNKLIEIGI